MHSFNYRSTSCCIFIALFLLFLLLSDEATALQLKMGSQSANPGDAITVDVTVADYNQEHIAAAAFTLSYNLDYLTLTGIDSDFFATFSDQWNSLQPVPNPLPPTSVVVDNQQYTQPILFATSGASASGKSLLVGVRVEAGTPSVLFTLHFTVNASTPAGLYPISISPTSLDNTAAGYDAGGTLIPVLYDALQGASDPSAAYPAYVPDIINGAINVQMPFTDSDGDGIDDNWEQLHFGSLTLAGAASDYDKDGYTDLQEYLNETAGETDPAGNAYDPLVKNAPGGTGFNPVSNGKFWLMVIPAITGSSHP